MAVRSQKLFELFVRISVLFEAHVYLRTNEQLNS